jgi:DNA-binding transcriptional regulator WhiA
VFTNLSIGSVIEFFIRENCIKIIRSLHKMMLRLVARAKSLEESSVIPDRHCVVRSVHPMNESLNRIAAIIQHKSGKSGMSQPLRRLARLAW